MMYDITFCYGQNCPLKETCLRHTATAYGRQDFFGSVPYDVDRNACQHYWDDTPSEGKIRDRAYQLWQQSGCPSGKDVAHWLQARQQLLDELWH